MPGTSIKTTPKEIIEKANYFLFCIHSCQKSIIFANERCEYLGVVENSIV